MTKLVEIRFKNKLQYLPVNTTLSDDVVISKVYATLRKDPKILRVLKSPRKRKETRKWVETFSFFGIPSQVEFSLRVYQSEEQAKEELLQSLVKVTIVPAHNCPTREYGPFDSDF